MPQMMPLSWLLLFFITLMTFYLFNNWNYWNFNYKVMKYFTSKKKSKKIWKW